MESVPPGRELVAKVATPEELTVPVPREAEPFRNVTVPVGVPDPEVGLTVAVNVTVAPIAIEEAELVRVVVVGVSGLKEVISSFASTDPRPVTWSYPTPAL